MLEAEATWGNCLNRYMSNPGIERETQGGYDCMRVDRGWKSNWGQTRRLFYNAKGGSRESVGRHLVIYELFQVLRLVAMARAPHHANANAARKEWPRGCWDRSNGFEPTHLQRPVSKPNFIKIACAIGPLCCHWLVFRPSRQTLRRAPCELLSTSSTQLHHLTDDRDAVLQVNFITGSISAHATPNSQLDTKVGLAKNAQAVAARKCRITLLR